jgi:heme-degrading monooxygenase HmoA
MIVRAWRGRAAKGNLAYVEHFRRNVMPALEKIEGFLGASLLREERAADIEFLVLSRWASMDAVHAFAGADASRAVVEAEAVAALNDYDRTVHHYVVVEGS